MPLSTTTDAIASAQKILVQAEHDAAIAKLITEGDSRMNQFAAWNRQNIVRSNLVATMWRKEGRKVLAIHPEIVNEVKVANSDKIPAEVLRALPYINPLVVYADPPEFPSWVKTTGAKPTSGTGMALGRNWQREAKMRILGFFVYSSMKYLRIDKHGSVESSNQQIGLTTDADADHLGIMMISEVLDEMGEVLDYELNSITLAYNITQTLGEHVDDLVARFHWDSPDAQNHPAARKWMRDIVATIVGSLFYLCSTTLEAEPVPTRATRHLAKGFARKPLSFYRVGWTTGAALTRYRQSRSRWASEQGDEAHQEQDPQHRRAYYAVRWHGPKEGPQIPKLTLVHAYWTHRERLGEEGVNIAHSVPHVGPKGDAQESVRIALEVMG